MKYADFITGKETIDKPSGVPNPNTINGSLFEFQTAIINWALIRGRAAIFADCGLGKTLMQLEWAQQVPGDVLIVAPLAVSGQTIDEANKFGTVIPEYSGDGVKCGKLTITNYERIERFNPDDYTGIVLDESSILKSHTGKYRTMIIERFGKIPFRLACTATPAPNDFMELGNHAEFLGVMTRVEMLSMFFVHDGGDTQKWRLKGHAQDEFWKWVCSWAVYIKTPADLGFGASGFDLPDLAIDNVVVDTNINADGGMFPSEARTLSERLSVRRGTINERALAVAEIVNKKPDEQWIIWCNLNNESSTVAGLIDGAVEVTGSDSVDKKESAMLGFSAGRVRVLVTKPSIAGFGMNWQNCHNIAFLGLSDSYEQYYQAMRRCWRFGQKHQVNCHIITSSQEGSVVKNIQRKEQDAVAMADSMVKNMSDISSSIIRAAEVDKSEYKTGEASGESWTMKLGDCVESIGDIGDESVDFSIFSPPFSSLYTYSNSDRDMGNSRSNDQFFTHMKYMVSELFRIIRSGRLVSFHCMNLPTSKVRDGYIGIRDFRGDLIRLFEGAGFIFHSEVCIWKNPVTAMQRTKALGLLHKQIVKDSCMSRQGIPDYLVTMRKPGENNNPVAGEFDHFDGDLSSFEHKGRLSIDVWQRYASPVWMDINQSNTIQHRAARDANDERHICPLQLDVIHRALQMWSNPGDLVFSPFAGVGSEGYESIMTGRRFIGIELKESYFNQALENLKYAEYESSKDTLFGKGDIKS